MRTLLVAVLLLLTSPVQAHQACDRDDLLRYPPGKLLLSVRDGISRREGAPLVGPLTLKDFVGSLERFDPKQRETLKRAFEGGRDVLETATSLAAIDYQLTGRPFRHRTLNYYTRHARAPLAQDLPQIATFLRRQDGLETHADAIDTAIALLIEAADRRRGRFASGRGTIPDNELASELTLGVEKRGKVPDYGLIADLNGLSVSFLATEPLHERAGRLVAYNSDAMIVLSGRLHGARSQLLFNELMSIIRECVGDRELRQEVAAVRELPEPFRTTAVLMRSHPIIFHQGFDAYLRHPYAAFASELPAAYERVGLEPFVERSRTMLALAGRTDGEVEASPVTLGDEAREKLSTLSKAFRWDKLYSPLITFFEQRDLLPRIAAPR